MSANKIEIKKIDKTTLEAFLSEAGIFYFTKLMKKTGHKEEYWEKHLTEENPVYRLMRAEVLSSFRLAPKDTERKEAVKKLMDGYIKRENKNYLFSPPEFSIKESVIIAQAVHILGKILKGFYESASIFDIENKNEGDKISLGEYKLTMPEKFWFYDEQARLYRAIANNFVQFTLTKIFRENEQL